MPERGGGSEREDSQRSCVVHRKGGRVILRMLWMHDAIADGSEGVAAMLRGVMNCRWVAE